MERIWVGIDVGKDAHHAVVVDAEGQELWSRRVPNDQSAIEELIAEAGAQGAAVTWAVDLTSSSAALVLGLLVAARQETVYVPGRTVNRMAGAYRGEGKTDAKDARVIADQARMRRDFHPAVPPDDLVAELGMLVGHRRDLMADRVRMISRLRELLTATFPALERALDYTSKGPLLLVERYQTPEAIRRAGRSRLENYLRKQGARNAGAIADKAVAAAGGQTVRLPGEAVAAKIVADVARRLLELDNDIGDIDKTITTRFHEHPHAAIIESMPGMGPLLGAEFVVATGDLSGFRDGGQLAAYAGLVPTPRDSGRRTGNLHRPKRYNRALRRVFYMSALSSLRVAGPSRDYYDRKRAEGRKHQQALIALARRRADVLWALLRDKRLFQPATPEITRTG